MPETLIAGKPVAAGPPRRGDRLSFDGTQWRVGRTDLNVCDFGAVPDGSHDSTKAFQDADAEKGCICVPPGIYRVDSDLEISSVINFVGSGKLRPAKDKRITLRGPVDAGVYQIFDLSLGGIVDIPRGHTTAIVPQWFGAAADGTTNDTVPIQQGLNCVAQSGFNELYFPAGAYHFGRLYLHHDATHNPGWPTAHKGHIRLRGSNRTATGRAGHGAGGGGTLLTSNDPTGPAISFDGDPTGGNQYSAMQVQMQDIAIMAKNTTQVVHWRRAPQISGFKNVYVRQEGTGDGILWENNWLSYVEAVTVDGPGKQTSKGTGFHAIYPAKSRSGGFMRSDGLIVNDFAKSIILGAEKYGDGDRMHSLHFRNCQGANSDIGVVIGHGAMLVRWECCHVENCHVGMQIQSGAHNIDVVTSSFMHATQGLIIGSDQAHNNRYSDVNVENCDFGSLPSTKEHIHVYGGENKKGVTIRNCSLDTKHNHPTIFVEPVEHHGLRIISSGSRQHMVNPERATLLSDATHTTLGAGASLESADSKAGFILHDRATKARHRVYVENKTLKLEDA